MIMCLAMQRLFTVQAENKMYEEYNGVLKTVIRPKEVVVKAINIDEWKLMEYSSKNRRNRVFCNMRSMFWNKVGEV